MIVKIQRPFATTEEVPMALIYNETRSVKLTAPFSDVEMLFNGRETKAYCRAKIENDHLIIGRKIRPQPF